jgi:hypothetical protein
MGRGKEERRQVDRRKFSPSIWMATPGGAVRRNLIGASSPSAMRDAVIQHNNFASAPV